MPTPEKPPTGRRSHPRAGRYSKADGDYWAFEPVTLPLEGGIDLGRLQPVLSQADLAVGRLDGVGEIVPNVDLFLSMYVRKEAVLSSKIEGTQTSLNELLAFDAGITDGQSETADDHQQVSNYVAALSGALEGVAERGLDLAMLQATHRRLLEGTRGEDKAPGQIRTNQNWIAGHGRTVGAALEEAIFVPPRPHLVMPMMENLIQFTRASANLPAVVVAGLAHAQFETIHPFLDGNGRLGRMLVTLLLCQRGVMRRPLLYLSTYLAERKGEYYQWLTKIREDGDWEGWLNFFLTGVAQVADNAVTTLRRITDLRSAHLELIRRSLKNKAAAPRLLDAVFRTPYLNAEVAASEIGASAPTTYTLLDDFVRIGILEEVTGRARGRLYAYRQYVELLYA